MKLYLSMTSTGGNQSHALLTLDQEGATIGRLADNRLVLPDANKYISGHHAIIHYRAPDYFITDTSTNGVLMNQSPIPLGNGNSAKLNDGDRIQIGNYTIAVKLIEASRPAPAVDRPPFITRGPHAASIHFTDDPFAEPGSDPIKQTIEDNELIPADWKGGNDPFDIPVIPGQAATGDAVVQPGAKDFEALAAFNEAFQPFKRQVEEQLPARSGPAPEAVPGNTFDDDWFSGDKNNKMAESRAPKSSPFADFPSAGEKTVPPFIPCPKPAKKNPSLEPAAPPARVGPEITPRVFDHLEPSPRVKPAKAPPAFETTDTARPGPIKPAPGSELEGELIRSFLRGAGLESSLRAETLNAASFYIIGKILRESIQGVKDVLIGRATIKNEMHLDVTTIRARHNNPIKFSVSAGEALVKLLTVQDKAYLKPEAAIKEVFDDIRAHEFAVIAGMRTALLSVLKRFDPGKLEQRLQDISPIAASIPFHKQAKLWSLFAHLYKDIGREAEDNFYHLFGQAFAETYELQMQNIKRSIQDRSSD